MAEIDTITWKRIFLISPRTFGWTLKKILDFFDFADFSIFCKDPTSRPEKRTILGISMLQDDKN